MVVQRDGLPVPLGLLGASPQRAINSSTRRRRSAARQCAAVDAWSVEVVAATNWLYGKDAVDVDTLSASQLAGVADISSFLSTLGSPEVSSAAALRALRGHRPGYDLQNK